MVCPKCGSNDVTVQFLTNSARTRGRGCLWGLMRAILIVCTCGLWLMIGRSKSKTNVQNSKMAVCQKCGHSWRLYR